MFAGVAINKPGNSLNSPRFLVANNPDKLSEAMRRNNAKWHMEFEYYIIQEVKKKWYAWYYFDHKRLATISHEDDA